MIMSEHNGAIVEKVIRRDGHSLTDIAKLTGVNRRSIYNWFLQPRLKPEIIIKIGKAIKHDFSVEFPRQFVSDDFQDKSDAAPHQGSEGDINIWKEKYIDLMERYNFLLTRKHFRSSINSNKKFNVLFVDDKQQEYKIDLNNPPTDLFLDKCRKAGYKINESSLMV
jgi:lambda repressor-like predicted transcriptional regulator